MDIVTLLEVLVKGLIEAEDKFIDNIKDFYDFEMSVKDLNRAVGFYLQKQGIPVIPNIRWSDESSFDYCFFGVPKHSIVCISTHGCLRSKEDKRLMEVGVEKMLEVLEPTDVIVHGYMPDKIFKRFFKYAKFHRFPSLFE